MAKQLRASLLTQRVVGWLEKTQQPRVLHVFSGVTNLINEEDVVLSIVNPFLGAGPFAMMLNKNIDFQKYVTENSVIAFGDTQIYCGELEIDIQNARLWQAKPEWAALQLGGQRRYSWLLDVIEQILMTEAPADSMAQVLLSHQLGAGHSPFFDRAFQGIELLRQGFTEANQRALVQGIKRLAGLGIGLTPAGDDFLIGIQHALWLTQLEEKAAGLSEQIANVAGERTNSISRAWLEAAAAGETGEPWHALMTGFQAEDQAVVEAAVARILPTGHTSGADALAGFIMLLGLETQR